MWGSNSPRFGRWIAIVAGTVTIGLLAPAKFESVKSVIVGFRASYPTKLASISIHMSKMTTIWVKKSQRDALADMGSTQDTYSDVLGRVLADKEQ